mmetsp:Transcript_52254/g.144768  ORF Transcript_52254/g.144768 Transcript_52254/m.144768 type:complete len:282 (+) Transcript_52254:160-1005(+)
MVKTLMKRLQLTWPEPPHFPLGVALTISGAAACAAGAAGGGAGAGAPAWGVGVAAPASLPAAGATPTVGPSPAAVTLSEEAVAASACCWAASCCAVGPASCGAPAPASGCGAPGSSIKRAASSIDVKLCNKAWPARAPLAPWVAARSSGHGRPAPAPRRPARPWASARPPHNVASMSLSPWESATASCAKEAATFDVRSNSVSRDVLEPPAASTSSLSSGGEASRIATMSSRRSSCATEAAAFEAGSSSARGFLEGLASERPPPPDKGLPGSPAATTPAHR